MKAFSFIAFFILAGCNEVQSSHESVSMRENSMVVDIKFIDSVALTVENSAVLFDKKCMEQLKVCWYSIERSANDENLIALNLDVGGSVLNLDQVVSVEIFSDEKLSKNIEVLNVMLRGLPQESSHEQYRVLIFDLIKKIKEVGWSHFFMPDDPRIPGSQVEKINTPGDVLGQYVGSHPWLDPDYKLDLQRWLQVGVFYNWYFYKDGNHLHLKAWRRNDERHPGEKGTYLITLEFQSEEQFWLSGFSEGQDRARWKELLPKRLENYQERRRVIEEKARAAGIEIDEAYQDPPIKALSR